ncbi:MAG: DUF3617 domain-containing protein [Rubrivivax sp.]
MDHAHRPSSTPLQSSRLPLAPLLAGLLCAGAANAQPAQLEPGLWEMTLRVSGAGMDDAMAQMHAQMATMSPQQRQMVEKMMASQGIGMGAKPSAVRVCITPEQAARAEPPAEPGCTQEVLERSRGLLKLRFECAGPPVSKGEGEYRIAGPKAYTGHMVVSTQQNGTPQRHEMDQSGRWIGADCGAIKPRSTR